MKIHKGIHRMSLRVSDSFVKESELQSNVVLESQPISVLVIGAACTAVLCHHHFFSHLEAFSVSRK